MGLNFNNFLKKHQILYVLFKCKANSFKTFKLYKTIKNLGFINIENYLNSHYVEKNNLNPIFHFIFYGSKEDNIELKKQYIDPIFDLDYYTEKYLEDSQNDCIIHYCLEGFYENYEINLLDGGYILNLKEDARKQIDRGIEKSIKKELSNNYYITDKHTLIPYIQSHKTYNTDTIKIGVFLNDPFKSLTACPYLRIHEPFRKLSNSKKFHFFVYGMDSYQFMDLNNIINSKVFDIVIVERILPFLDILLNKCLTNDIKLIYETDDDLLAIEENNSSFEYINRCRKEITDYIANSDCVVVTTPALAKKFNNNKVEIIRNYYIDDLLSLKKFKKNDSNLIKIGYFGTLTHSNDLELIKNVITNLKDDIKKEHDIDLEFVVIGGFNDPNQDESWISKIELPENSWDFEFFMRWLGEVVDWDIGIAPLENSDFNKGKSELKYIEYSALGIPTVCSDVEPYNSVIKDGFTGFLVGSEEEWYEKLEILILNNNLREKIVSNSQEDILKNYSLNDRVKQWENLLEKLIK